MAFANDVSAVIKRYFISGVLVVVPIILTYIVLKFLFEAIDGILQALLTDLLGYYRTGLGVITLLLIILLVGLLTRNFIGHKIYQIGDRLLARVPIVRPIYSAAKQLLEAMASDPTSGSFKEVGLIEYPRKGAYSVGFIGRRIGMEIDGEVRHFFSVFMPSTPTPLSGMVVMIPEDQVTRLNMTIEEGIKFIVSGGVAAEDLLTPKAPDDTHTGKR